MAWQRSGVRAPSAPLDRRPPERAAFGVQGLSRGGPRTRRSRGAGCPRRAPSGARPPRSARRRTAARRSSATASRPARSRPRTRRRARRRRRRARRRSRTRTRRASQSTTATTAPGHHEAERAVLDVGGHVVDEREDEHRTTTAAGPAGEAPDLGAVAPRPMKPEQVVGEAAADEHQHERRPARAPSARPTRPCRSPCAAGSCGRARPRRSRSSRAARPRTPRWCRTARRRRRSPASSPRCPCAAARARSELSSGTTAAAGPTLRR